jgi:hypothetical protein
MAGNMPKTIPTPAEKERQTIARAEYKSSPLGFRRGLGRRIDRTDRQAASDWITGQEDATPVPAPAAIKRSAQQAEHHCFDQNCVRITPGAPTVAVLILLFGRDQHDVHDPPRAAAKRSPIPPASVFMKFAISLISSTPGGGFDAEVGLLPTLRWRCRM